MVDDPLFPHSRPSGSTEAALNQFLGFGSRTLDKTAVAESCQFLRELRPMVAAGFLKCVPVSAVLEPSTELPITYSTSLFAERVPEDVREWVRHRARVRMLRPAPDGRGWYWLPDEPTAPARAICIEFDDYAGAFPFFLTSTKFMEPAKGSGGFTLVQTLPETPPSHAQFAVWVEQSINQSAGNVLNHLQADLDQAAKSGCMLLTRSAFISDLLSRRVPVQPVQESMANLALRLELPVLRKVAIVDLMNVRKNHGEAFHAFRLALQTHLRDIRTTTDEHSIRQKLENLQHEFAEVQLVDVQREVRRVRRDVLGSLVIGAASLAAVLPTGMSVAGLVGTAAGAFKAATGYLDRVAPHPAYFLWRLHKESDRTTRKRFD